ncbi:MAG: DUF2844 domain-containing protein [Terriglobales bacterium]
MRALGSGLMLTLAAGLALAWPAGAQTLGATVRATEGQVRELAQTGSKVEQVRRDNGTVIRAYISPSGQVFGLAWQGAVVPDMSQLLGPHFAAFQAAARAQRNRRGPLYVHTGDLVVEMSGHMRDFRGRAYLTSALPSNLTPAVVH